MSKFTNKPYIETILAELSGENKGKLLNLINGKNAAGTADISYTLVDSLSAMASLDAGVTAVAFKFSPSITWKGYFVRTTNYKSFITFENAIDLTKAGVYKVESNHMSLMEDVTADNVRSLLREDSYVDVSEASTAIQQAVGNKATVWKTDISDFDGLPNSLLNKVKVGDIIFGSVAESIAIVIDEVDNVIEICAFGYDELEYIQFTKSNNTWEITNIYHSSFFPTPEEGTIDKVLGLDSSGNVVKGSVSGGTKLYKHRFTIECSIDSNVESVVINVITTKSSPTSLVTTAGPTRLSINPADVVASFNEDANRLISLGYYTTESVLMIRKIKTDGTLSNAVYPTNLTGEVVTEL